MIDYFIYYREEQNQWILRDAESVLIGVYTRKDSAVRRIKTLSNGSDCHFVVVLDSSQCKSQSYLLINKAVVLVKDYQQILDYEQSCTNHCLDIKESKFNQSFEQKIDSSYLFQNQDLERESELAFEVGKGCATNQRNALCACAVVGQPRSPP